MKNGRPISESATNIQLHHSRIQENVNSDIVLLEDIQSALTYVQCGDNQQRLRIGAALKNSLGEAGRPLWDDWRAGRGDDEAKDVWRSIKPHRTNGITIRTLFWEACNNGWKPQRAYKENDYSALREQAKREAAEAEKREREEQAKREPELLSLWNKAQPITKDDPAGKYLLNRGLSAPNDATALRYIPDLTYRHEGNSGVYTSHPAMLAAVTSPTGKLVTLHRTYLDECGLKAAIPSPKKLMPACGSLQGASVKLAPPSLRNNRLSLGVAEGIETALAATALFGVPTWALISTAGFMSFTVPRGVQKFYVFGDNDGNGAGQKATQSLADRAARLSSAEVRLHTPEQADTDWCDYLAKEVCK